MECSCLNKEVIFSRHTRRSGVQLILAITAVGVVIGILFGSNHKALANPAAIPSITSLAPTSGPIGTLITVSGSGFTPTDNTVNFGSGFVSELNSSNGTLLSFALLSTLTVCPGGPGMGVPCFTGSPVTPGQYQASVQNTNGTSNSMPFTVTSVSPPPPSLINFRVKRVGSAGSTLLTPNTSAWFDTSAPDTNNPSDFIVSVGQHTAFVNNVAGYTITAGICSRLLSDPNGCSVSSFPLTPTCNDMNCSVPVNIVEGQFTKVVFKYTVSSFASPPNIIVIMSDDQDDTGSMSVMAKVNDLLSKRGVTFKNSFVENPICCPSRVTFLTGQVSHNNTVLANNNRVDGGYKRLLPTADNTLPVWLKQAGYQTAFVGKYVNGYPAGLPLESVAPGWDMWFGLVTPYRYYGYTVSDNGILRTYGSNVTDYQTDVLAKKAIDYINARALFKQSFFLWLAPVAPHWGEPGGAGPEPAPRHKGLFANVPLPQPSSFNEADISDKPLFMRLEALPMDAVRLQYASESFRQRRESLLAVDEMVGNIVDALTKNGQLNNTLIIYTSDNGFFHGEHRLPQGKQLLYDESIRVPLVMRGPGIAHGVIRSELVNNTDLVATIVETAKARPGRILDGHSLSPLLKNTETPWRTVLLLEGEDAVPFGSGERNGMYAAVRTNQFLYAEHTLPTGAVEPEFYDIAVDPYELESRPKDQNYGQVIQKLADMLHALKSCLGETCWRTNPDPQAPSTRTAPVTAPITALSGSQNVTKLDASTLQKLGPQDADETSWAPSTISPQNPFPKVLRLSMSGTDVANLQTLLARDPLLYPEGLITGYFGVLTKQAVVRFQEKYASDILVPAGLKKGSGFVGPLTLKKLGEFMK